MKNPGLIILCVLLAYVAIVFVVVMLVMSASRNVGGVPPSQYDMVEPDESLRASSSSQAGAAANAAAAAALGPFSSPVSMAPVKRNTTPPCPDMPRPAILVLTYNRHKKFFFFFFFFFYFFFFQA